MDEVLFFIAALGALAGAAGTVTLRNPFYSVLALVFHLLSLAALFLLLTSAFVAAAQVVVYAGAVMVLYVFVVGYIGGTGEQLHAFDGRPQRGLAVLFGGAVFVELAIAAYSPSARSGVRSMGSASSISLVKIRSERS
jgi:NADH:ubiquinone oxidoreductase subunit 6 (subunit J)